jgi:hypothetical protein
LAFCWVALRATNHHHSHGHEEDGKRQPRVDDEHERLVDAAAVISGDHAKGRPDEARDEHHREPDSERHAGAVDQAREIVAAEAVGSQKMRRVVLGVA